MLKPKINEYAMKFLTLMPCNSKIEGSSALGMVIILLFLGVILINSLNKTSLSWQKSFIYQKIYYKQFNAARSSLEWGLTQLWQSPNKEWQCQSLSMYQLSACVKQSSIAGNKYVLLKGQSGEIAVYYLATFEIKTANLGALTIEQGHWLDYCPESYGGNCD